MATQVAQPRFGEPEKVVAQKRKDDAKPHVT